MNEFRFRGNAREFEKKLQQAMKRARASKEFRDRFLRMASRTECADGATPLLKADFPRNFN